MYLSKARFLGCSFILPDSYINNYYSFITSVIAHLKAKVLLFCHKKNPFFVAKQYRFESR